MAEVTKKDTILQWLSNKLLLVRVKWRTQKHKKDTFILSFLITYLLTIGLSAGVLITQIDNKIWGEENVAETIAPNPSEITPNTSLDSTVRDETQSDTSQLSFDFYGCPNVSVTVFVVANLLETLVPTAITFCGTILILQSNAMGKQKYMALLFVVIVFLVIGGIVLPTVKTVPFLVGCLWVLGLLCTMSIIFSWKVFAVASSQTIDHKTEPSDGKIVF